MGFISSFSPCNRQIWTMIKFLVLFVQVLDPNSVDFLSQPFTAKEVQATLKEMHPTKSLGPDSFHALFYQ